MKRFGKKYITIPVVFLLVAVIAGSLAVGFSNGGKKVLADETTTEKVQEQKTDGIPMTNAVVGEGLIPMAETDSKILYFDNNSGGVAIQLKGVKEMDAQGVEADADMIIYSNPVNALTDAKADDTTKNKMMSQVQVTYYMRKKQAEATMNSYTNALLLDQVRYGKIDNGVRVSMTIGREQQLYLLPQQISKENFEALLEKVTDERQKRTMKGSYIFYTLTGLEESKANELAAKYPALKEMDMYILKTDTKDRSKVALEETVKATGYTYEMLEADHLQAGFNADDAVFPSFRFSIDYVFVNDSLEVKLNVGDMIYDSTYFYLTNIELLNFFAAGETGKDGYLFIPDGSGSLIKFNDGSKSTLLTKSKLYGQDNAITPADRSSFKNDFRLPVFGIKSNNSAVLGIIEKGDAIAEINAEIGNISHSYNTTYANFVVRNTDKFVQQNAFEQQPWIMYEKVGFTGEIAMRYYFLSNDDADYVGMAKMYQKYLKETGQIEKMSSGENLPFYLETYGDIPMVLRKFGIPMNTPVAITSFDDAYTMIKEFNEQGIDNIKLRYKGFYNGGYYPTAAINLKVDKVLGGSKGLKELSKKAEELGATIYPDVDFLNVSNDKNFDGFTPRTDSVRNLFQKMTGVAEVDLASFSFYYNTWCMNPNKLPENFKSFTKGYDKLGLKNISMSTVGEGLNSNFKNSSYVNRQDSLGKSVEIMSKADEKYDGVISDGGNAYVFPYINHLLNLPVSDSSLIIADEAVPFAQIALHGYISYAATPINLSSDMGETVLKCIEYGSGAYFLLNYADSSLMRRAQFYEEIYAVHYDSWKNDVTAIYNELNKALKQVEGNEITNHEKIADGVYKTTYENGVSFVVNYNDTAVDVDGVSVSAKEYVVLGGK